MNQSKLIRNSSIRFQIHSVLDVVGIAVSRDIAHSDLVDGQNCNTLTSLLPFATPLTTVFNTSLEGPVSSSAFAISLPDLGAPQPETLGYVSTTFKTIAEWS